MSTRVRERRVKRRGARSAEFLIQKEYFDPSDIDGNLEQRRLSREPLPLEDGERTIDRVLAVFRAFCQCFGSGGTEEWPSPSMRATANATGTWCVA